MDDQNVSPFKISASETALGLGLVKGGWLYYTTETSQFNRTWVAATERSIRRTASD